MMESQMTETGYLWSMILFFYQAQTLSFTTNRNISDCEMKTRKTINRNNNGEYLIAFKALTRESQDPVHKLMPSLLTPRQLTRFSWPLKEPTLSPRRTSQTCKRQLTPLCNEYCTVHIPCTRSHHSRRRAIVQRPRKQQT